MSILPTVADLGESSYWRWLAAVAGLTAVYGLVGIGWGLPNGNDTWAADSVAPMTPFAVAYHVFAENGFNSGYFYFKYPVGHQLLLAVLGAPILALAALTGGLHSIETDYPFGLSHPEPVLTALSVEMRLVSVAATMGITVLIAALARRFAGRRAGVFAALVALGCYPLVFYAHTSNVEAPYLFWALLALYSTVRATEEGSQRWLLTAAAAAAMAVSTKEQIAGFLLLLPLPILSRCFNRSPNPDRPPALSLQAVAAALGLAILVFLVVNAAFFNPSGLVHRIQFLTHTLDPAVRARYAAYEFPLDMTKTWSLGSEAAHAGEALRVVGASIGWHVVAIAAAGLGILAAGQRRALMFLVLPLLGYYATSLRILNKVEIRYLLPISVLLAVPAGIALARAWQHWPRTRPAAAVVLAIGLVYSGEVLVMLVGDARYACEDWMAPRLATGKRVEVYQSWTYLPRWRRVAGVQKPPAAEITIEGFRKRRPDYVVLSSKGKEGITMYPNPDWRDGRGMMLESAERRAFLDALESGTLGYREVARFERPVLFKRMLITSLNPSITVYGRIGEDKQR